MHRASRRRKTKNGCAAAVAVRFVSVIVRAYVGARCRQFFDLRTLDCPQRAEHSAVNDVFVFHLAFVRRMHLKITKRFQARLDDVQGHSGVDVNVL